MYLVSWICFKHFKNNKSLHYNYGRCGNDESSAASQLSDLGFQSSPDHKQKSHVHSTSSPKKSTLSPDHHALANHSKQQALKPVLTQDEKRQCKD